MSTTQSLDFPHAMMHNRMSYCGNILRHLKNRPDLNLGTFGDNTLELLSRFRSILPEHVSLYYENLSAVMNYLCKYAEVAENCAKSGAYQTRRLERLEQVKSVIYNLDQDMEMVRYLRGMHQPGTFLDATSNHG